MKITIERDELKSLLCGALSAKFGGEWECCDYGIPAEAEFEQVTEAYRAAKEKKEKERAARLARTQAPEPVAVGSGEDAPL